MLNVGIMNPDWTVLRHNTDHVCVMDFAGLDQYEPDLRLSFVGTRWQYLKANLNTAASRLWQRRLFPSIPLHQDRLNADALYRYGPEVQGLSVVGRSHPPILTTGGFPSLRQVIGQGAAFMQAQANALETWTRDTTLIHFHTEAMREQYLQLKPTHADRCITVPFFLPQLAFLTEAQVREKFDQPETVLLFVGADGQRKGLEELCQALDTISEQLERWQVRAVIVSKHTPVCHRFKRVRHEKKLPRQEVQALMRQAHIYCMVPRYESFGLVYVEAMAAGCAVIADDDLPRQEVLDGGRCGMLLPARQPQAIAQALCGLLEDRARTLALAQAGQDRARARYAPATVARDYARAFARLVT